jgi:sulfite exporter TauE/SafE
MWGGMVAAQSREHDGDEQDTSPRRAAAVRALNRGRMLTHV